MIIKTKIISKYNWKLYLCYSRWCLIILFQPNHQTDQTKFITEKSRIPMNTNVLLIGTFKWISHPSLDVMRVWATLLNIWWVKRKWCLNEKLTKILVFFIMIPFHWWHKRKILSGLKSRDTNKCESHLKLIYYPATLF